MGMAVSSYRYESKHTDEPLRTKLVELAREKPRFGYRRLHVLLRRSGERVKPDPPPRIQQQYSKSLCLLLQFDFRSQ
jgi:hypothetical protein